MLGLLSLSFVLCSAQYKKWPVCSESERKLYPGVKWRNSYKMESGKCTSTCERRNGNNYNSCSTASDGEIMCSQADDLDVYGCPLRGTCDNKRWGSTYDFYFQYLENYPAHIEICSTSTKTPKICQKKFDSKRLDKKFKRRPTTIDAPHCKGSERKLYNGVNGRNTYKNIAETGPVACESKCEERRNGNHFNTCYLASGEEMACSQADDLDVYGCPIEECIGGYGYGYFYGKHPGGNQEYCSKQNEDLCKGKYTSAKLDQKFGGKYATVDAPAFTAWLNQTTLGMGVVVSAGILASVALFAFRRRNLGDPSSDIEEQMSD